ncbi:MAG: 23S rRNA (pseudouridine(1915)-N(3))-methyltransferase RlmH [Oscillospiraceae bacterium]|nr:23S rRNA (pseudouridine(1915)-N(3))-methyltransferase RlmH [Oscillospiraceae bacterium]
MVNVTLICVGKLKEKFYLAAVDEYVKRLSAFCRLSVVELNEVRLPDRPSQAQIDAALLQEARQILEKVPKASALIPMCVEGKTLSSPELAKRMEQWAVQGQSSLTFVIGGSFGLHDLVKEKALFRLSMSPMTFPHHLARVMVLEQIYRSFQINAGSKYHK